MLYVLWITALVAAVSITLSCERESTAIQGIAETREMTISSESSVDIRRINVVEGQSVTKGQLLVELVSPELTLKINHISHQLDQLRAQKGVNKDEIRSKIRQLEAEKASLNSEVRNQIRLIENQYNLNKELASGLKSIVKDKKGAGDMAGSGASNPVTLQIESLRQELALSLRPLNIQIELLQKSLDEAGSPIKIQVEQLEKELALLKSENSKLNIYAQMEGIIGSVNFKPGEKASPFAPILTLHTKNPSFVKGYIHENVYTRMTLGKKVTIVSQTDSRNSVPGSVVGVGARIVEYPARLRKNPVLQSYGREVLVQIPEDNGFILGEKVVITSSEPKITLLSFLREQRSMLVSYLKKFFGPEEIHAEIPPAAASVSRKSAEGVTYIASPMLPLKTSDIEASAIVRLDDIDRWLVLSDDTPDKKPLLFLMDGTGRITKESQISGLKEINDMESAATGDEGTLYIACSLNANKKGKIEKSRRLLVSVKREGDKFSLIRKADLYDLLEESAARNKNEEWAQFVLSAMEDRSLDIEGMFYHDAALYLGFKSPFYEGHSVILKIDSIDEMFCNEKLDDAQVSVWKKILLKTDETLQQEHISDLFYHNSTLYVTGTLSDQAGGSLWKLDENTGNMTRVASFDGLRPEGIAAGSSDGTLIISFDQGGDEPSQIAVVEGVL
jgi:multidrug resistance efflux pump